MTVASGWSNTQILFSLATVGLSYLLFRWITRRGPLSLLPGPPSSSFITGNMLDLIDRHGWDYHLRLIQDHGSVVKLNGLFNEPILYVFDPKALEHLLGKDPGSLEQAPEALAAYHIMFGPGMAAVPAAEHRNQRKVINPAFSLNHLRSLGDVFYDNAYKLCDGIKCQVTKGSMDVDVFSWMGRVMLEIIGQGGLGYSFDALTENATMDEFERNVKAMAELLVDLPILRQILPLMIKLSSPNIVRWALQYSPIAKAREFGRSCNVLVRHSEELYRNKKRAMLEGNRASESPVEDGKDIVNLLIRANNLASDKDRLPEAGIVGQMALMVFAAVDTTANYMARLLHHMALRSDVQEKIRKEVLEAGINDCNIAVDDLLHLPFLDAVYKETMRVNAPVPLITRRVTKDTVLPLSRPVQCTDGTTINQVLMPKDTKIFLGVFGSNLSKELWGDDALEWKPERWLAPLPEAVSSIPGIYANLMTFVGGPRACIGFKFAEIEIKVLTAVLLSRSTFSLGEIPIYWNLGYVAYPTTSPDSKHHGKLFLKVAPLPNASD